MRWSALMHTLHYFFSVQCQSQFVTNLDKINAKAHTTVHTHSHTLHTHTPIRMSRQKLAAVLNEKSVGKQHNRQQLAQLDYDKGREGNKRRTENRGDRGGQMRSYPVNQTKPKKTIAYHQLITSIRGPEGHWQGSIDRGLPGYLLYGTTHSLKVCPSVSVSVSGQPCGVTPFGQLQLLGCLLTFAVLLPFCCCHCLPRWGRGTTTPEC